MPAASRPRPQPSHDREPPERRVREAVVAFRQRQGGEGEVHVGRRGVRPANAGVIGWKHAHDGGGDVVDADDRADGARLGAEPALPERVADHGHRLGPRPVVVGDDGAAGGRLHAEHAEVVAGGGQAGRHLGPSVDDQGQRRRGRREHPVEGLAGVAQRFEDGIGEGPRNAHSPGGAEGRHVPGRAVVAAPAQAHETVGVGHRQRPEEHAVDGAEERGVGADAQRERDQHHERPAPGLPQHPDRMTKVVQHLSTSTEASGPESRPRRVRRWFKRTARTVTLRSVDGSERPPVRSSKSLSTTPRAPPKRVASSRRTAPMTFGFPSPSMRSQPAWRRGRQKRTSSLPSTIRKAPS